MCEGFACVGRPVDSPESAVMSGEFQNGRLFTGFLHCVKVSHNLNCVDVLYRETALTTTFNFNRITFKNGVLYIASHAVHFIFLFSKCSVVTDEQNCLNLYINMMDIHSGSAIIPSFLA